MIGFSLFILLACGILLLLKAVLLVQKSKQCYGPSTNKTAGTFPFPYTARHGLFSLAERNFLAVLEIALEGRARVYGKVRMEDIVAVAGASGSKRMSARGRIKSSHIDFVLCDPVSSSFLAAIELDDRSHLSTKAIELDEFKNQCFQKAGIPLLRFNAKHGYTMQEIRHRLPPALSGNKGPGYSPATAELALPIALAGHPELEEIASPAGHNGEIQLSQAPSDRLRASLKSEGYQAKKRNGSWIWSRHQ